MKKRKTICIMLACAVACSALVACSEQERGIELPHYDQSADQNYNPDLFYRNDMTSYNADPSVLWVPEDRDEKYGGYFYMYSTDNIRSFGVRRSRDLINWEYIQTAFVSEADGWAKDRMYAPECIYDETDGKYYLFFSASWAGRENGYLYDSYADKAAYESAAATAGALGLADAETIIADYENLFAAEDAGDGYSAEQWQAAKEALADYRSSTAEGADEETRLAAARDCVLNVRTVKIHKTASVDYAYSIGVAVSESPVGPFAEYTNVEGSENYDENERAIGIGTPFIAHEDFYTALSAFKASSADGDAEKADKLENAIRLVGDERFTMIDADPFVDPVTGDKYLYFSRVQRGQQYTYGIKLGKKWTDDPQWETLTALTRYGYATVDSSEEIDYPKTSYPIEEGPHMYFDEETRKYYLTFSINGSYDKEYAVAQAISDSPLGGFTKVPMEKGGLVIAADMAWDHISGPGHHCFVNYDGKMYILYQGLYERANPSGNPVRGICVDEIKTLVNDEGVKVLNANGPTYAPMPKIGPDAKYKNIADKATVTVSGGSNKEALNDGLLNIMTHHDQVKEYTANGKTTITLDFDDYETVRAVMVYNARDIEKWFDKVDRIELDFKATKDGAEVFDTAFMKNLAFDKELYTTALTSTARPGGAVCAEFDELSVKTIRITINSDKAFAVSEIFVLGK